MTLSVPEVSGSAMLRVSVSEITFLPFQNPLLPKVKESLEEE